MSKKKIVALLVTIIFLVLIFYKIDIIKLLHTFKLFNFKNIWLIVPFYVSTLYMRGIRWKSLLLNDKKYSSYHLGAVFTVGSMLNIFLPARAGDIYRAYYLGSVKDESKMKIFGSIILERTMDGICVFLMLLLAILLSFKQPWIINIAYLIGIIFIGSFVAFYLIFKFNKVDFIFEKLILLCKKLPASDITVGAVKKLQGYTTSFIDGFEVLNSLRCTTEAFVMSIIVWGVEIYVAYLIINSFNLQFGFSAAMFVLSLISFSTMLPSTSVFLGPYQYAYILALGIYGTEKSTTLAISTIHQGLLAIMLSVIGIYYLTKFNFSLKECRAAVKIEEQKK